MTAQNEAHTEQATGRGEGPRSSRSVGSPLAVRLIGTGLSATGWASPQLAGRLALRLFTRPRRRKVQPSKNAECFSTPFEGGDLACYRWGTSGKRVLLVHGWDDSAQSFRSVARELAQDHTVIAFDAPGHGDSPGRESTLLAFVAAIRTMWRAIGGADYIVAHSLGATAATLALVEDGSVKPEAVVLLSAPDRFENVLTWFANFIGLSPVAHQALSRALEQRVGKSLSYYVTSERARACAARALVIHDCDDTLVPIAEGRAIAASWPGAQLITTQRLGHRRALTDPQTIRSIAEFIREGAPRG